MTNTSALKVATRAGTIFKFGFKRKLRDSFRREFILCLFVSGIGFLGGCSLDKELPIACVSDDKMVIRELCRKYKGKIDENRKKETLLEHGFNERDVEAIYLYSIEKSTSCKVTVARQCDLIAMRNGVGY